MVFHALLTRITAILSFTALGLIAAPTVDPGVVPSTLVDESTFLSPATLYSRGMAFLEGKGVIKNTPEAIRWLTRAASMGHHASQLQLAHVYQSNEGVPTDPKLAVQWFEQAAGWNSAEAQYEMAKYCAAGLGTPLDEARATSYYLKAAEQGLAKAQHDVAVRYDLGKGVPVDKAVAAKWYLAAAEQGVTEAKFNYASMLDTGEGVARNPREAVRWFREAAVDDSAKAQYNLALHYESGVGVPRDAIQAFAWYNVAASSGLPDAIKARNTAEALLGHDQALKGQEMSREFFHEIILGSSPAKGDAPKLNLTPADADRERGTGSGSIISSDGLILTVAHVIANAHRVVAELPSGIHEAVIVRVDVANDLALLRIEGSDYQPITLAENTAAKLGQSVSTIGFPHPDIQGTSVKATRGEISSMDGAVDEPRDWQISVPVQNGNSGGPLLDEHGHLLGIIVSKLIGPVNEDLPQNVNYARKGAYIRAFLEPFAFEVAAAPELPSPTPAFPEMIEVARKSVVLLRVY